LLEKLKTVIEFDLLVSLESKAKELVKQASGEKSAAH
jgi:hypothetical protein